MDNQTPLLTEDSSFLMEEKELLGKTSIFHCHPKHPMTYKCVDKKNFGKHLFGIDYKCMECYDTECEYYWYCDKCPVYLCNKCAQGKVVIKKNEMVDITLRIVEGCWNKEVFGNSVDFTLAQKNDLGLTTLVKDPHAKVWVESEKYSYENEIGIVYEPFEFQFRNVPIAELSKIKLKLRIAGKGMDHHLHSSSSSSSGSPEYNISSIPLKEIADEYIRSYGQNIYPLVKRNWNHCGISRRPDADLSTPQGHERVPSLYILEKNRYGWLNIECELNGFEVDAEDKLSDANRTKTWLIDDIDVVKMMINNRARWQDFYQYLSTDIYKKAFEIYLSAYWFDVLPTCIVVLSSINYQIDNEKPGNWDVVKSECEEVVKKLLQELPRVEVDDKVFHLLSNILSPSQKGDYFYLLVKNDLKVFPSQDIFFNFVSRYWNEKSVDLVCCVTSLQTKWILSLLSFFIFLVLLSFHIFVVDPRPQLLLNHAMNNMLGDTESISNFSSFTDWFRNTMIPALYDDSDNHLYFLTDDVVVRLIRIPPTICENPEEIPSLDEIEQCYPRLTNTFKTWNPEPWHNFTVMNIGKYILVTTEAIYDSRGDTIILSRNQTIAEETLNKIDFGNWLDWSIQAVIMEFVMYSPNLQLFSICAIVSEFSNVGTFEMHSECAVVSPIELSQANSIIVILLYIFLTAFLLEEAWELFRLIYGMVPLTWL